MRIPAALAALALGCGAADEPQTIDPGAPSAAPFGALAPAEPGGERGGDRGRGAADGDSAPRPLELSGDLRTHDPALINEAASGAWYVFSTGDPALGGGSVQIRRATDLGAWSYLGTVSSAMPEWVSAAVPGVTNLWAPEVYEHAGVYYLYYAASTFGSNRSVIGLMTNASLDPAASTYAWIDRGLVLESTPDNDYNAIDPALIEDEAGTPWLAFGSYWSGIRMLQLSWPDGKPVPGKEPPLRLADRFVPPNAVEAPAIVRRGGWYYLFVSFDSCCRGTDSTYKIAVGRSPAVTGPYYDQLGTPLAHGGGTVILSENGSMFGPGGQSVHRGWLAYHWYDGNAGGDFRLGLRQLGWENDGWPRVVTPAD